MRSGVCSAFVQSLRLRLTEVDEQGLLFTRENLYLRVSDRGGLLSVWGELGASALWSMAPARWAPTAGRAITGDSTFDEVVAWFGEVLVLHPEVREASLRWVGHGGWFGPGRAYLPINAPLLEIAGLVEDATVVLDRLGSPVSDLDLIHRWMDGDSAPKVAKAVDQRCKERLPYFSAHVSRALAHRLISDKPQGWQRTLRSLHDGDIVSEALALAGVQVDEEMSEALTQRYLRTSSVTAFARWVAGAWMRGEPQGIAVANQQLEVVWEKAQWDGHLLRALCKHLRRATPSVQVSRLIDWIRCEPSPSNTWLTAVSSVVALLVPIPDRRVDERLIALLHTPLQEMASKALVSRMQAAIQRQDHLALGLAAQLLTDRTHAPHLYKSVTPQVAHLLGDLRAPRGLEERRACLLAVAHGDVESALLELLESHQPNLQLIAIWGLGRAGGRASLLALRRWSDGHGQGGELAAAASTAAAAISLRYSRT